MVCRPPGLMVEPRWSIYSSASSSKRGNVMTHRFSPRPVALVVAAAMSSTLAGCQPAGEGGVGQTAVDTAAIMSAADSFRTPYAEAYNAADSATIREMYSVGVVYLPPEGRPITGRQEVFSVLAGGMTRNLGGLDSC